MVRTLAKLITGAVLLALAIARPGMALGADSSALDRLENWLDSFTHFNPANPDTWPFIPIPMIATDPNGGTTYGIIPTLLSHDPADGHIEGIFAPDVTNNGTLGPGATLRYFDYPSSDTQWFVNAGFQREIARHVDVNYATGRDRQDPWSFNGELFWERDPTERFFGIGNMSRQSNETNYTTEQLYFRGTLGLNLSPAFQLSLTVKPRYVRITPGAFDYPFIGNKFPNLKDVSGGSEVPTQLAAAYDTRDSIDLPTDGGLALAYAGLADRRLGSSVSYTRFGGELRRYFSLGSRVVVAAHTFLEFTPAGDQTPFWTMARLGGDASLLTDQQPLRGYGTGRFVDNNLEVVNLETRIKVFEATLFQTRGALQLAPFVEAGRVSHLMTANPLNRFHTAGGLGFRAVAEPFVVGFVDVGYASEGFTLFSGINYPF